jgi:hypothetical protein
MVAAEPFDYDKPAELFPGRTRVSRRQSYGYMRFDRAADAIRFAMERLPPKLLVGACLEVDEVRIDSHGIRHFTTVSIIRSFAAPRRSAGGHAQTS